MENKATDKQIEFINKLLEGADDIAKEKSKFLTDKGLDNLDKHDASFLINILKKYSFTKPNEEQALDRTFNRKPELKPKHDAKVGDIFASSWGYSMRLNSFYQVTALIGSVTLELKKIESEYTSGDGWQGYERAKPNCFKQNEETLRKRYNGEYITISTYEYAKKLEDVSKEFYYDRLD